jgi:hypothetical protein
MRANTSAEFRMGVSFFGPIGSMPTIEMDRRFKVWINATAPLLRGKECAMPYSITLRSRTDARITGWYDGSGSRWSTDHRRQKLFEKKRDARPICHELRSLCPRNAKVINIEAEQDDPFPQRGATDFSSWAEC